MADDFKQISKNKGDKKKPKGAYKDLATIKADGAKGKGKRKRETSEMEPEEFEQGLGQQVHVDDVDVNKQTIVDTLSVQNVLVGRVFLYKYC